MKMTNGNNTATFEILPTRVAHGFRCRVKMTTPNCAALFLGMNW